MEEFVKNKIHIIILAAGKGTRMNSTELPKVLTLYQDKPMIKHLLSSVEDSTVCETPVIVVGYKAEMVKEALGNNYTYVTQVEQLGTGHAVMTAESALKNIAENIMVLYGDHPTISAETISNIAKVHQENNGVLTMATVKVDDFDDWRNSFYDYGRIIRDGNGDVSEIIEKKDATDEQREILEVNPGYYCFKADWLWENLHVLKNENSQHEYYLTDLVKLAVEGGHKIYTVEIDPKQALGVNTVEQLELIENLS